MEDYAINIFFDKRDGVWIADIPDLEYCSAHGDTPEKALEEVLVAKRLWLESAKKHNDPIPEPKYSPIELEKFHSEIAKSASNLRSSNDSLMQSISIIERTVASIAERMQITPPAIPDFSQDIEAARRLSDSMQKISERRKIARPKRSEQDKLPKAN